MMTRNRRMVRTVAASAVAAVVFQVVISDHQAWAAADVRRDATGPVLEAYG